MHLKEYTREHLKKLWGAKGMLKNIGQGKADQDKADKILCIYTEILLKRSVITQR